MAEQNGTEKTLTAKQRDAAVLLAEDDLPDHEIADRVGIGRTTLHRWKERDDFKQAMTDHAAELERRMLRLAIARKRHRLEILDTLQTKMVSLFDARSEQYADVPGGPSGLIVGQLKKVTHVDSTGDDGTKTWTEEEWEYAFDAALVRELRGIQEQAAKELGQWSDQVKFAGEIGIRRYIGVDPDAV